MCRLSLRFAARQTLCQKSVSYLLAEFPCKALRWLQ